MAFYVDAHCHVSTKTTSKGGPMELPSLPVQRCLMSNNGYDWGRIKELKFSNSGNKVGFGIHPWYSHMYYIDDQTNRLSKETHYKSVLHSSNVYDLNRVIEQLPEPVSLTRYIAEEFDRSTCDCIGEIGLDKLFRLPENGFYQGDKSAPLGRVKVKIEHQVKVFEQMCQLAVAHSLPVSVHCVKCPSLMYELCMKLLSPHREINVCLHSFTGSLETLAGMWLKNFPNERLFFSLSRYINFKNHESASKLLQVLPLECILTETDFTWDTVSGELILRELDFLLSQIAHNYAMDSPEQAKQMVFKNFQRFI
ncbi:LANO_0F13586g1_1 [Lachancea nothofagi CBS 11611]|uniref:LANO_0F13586g1_1 n=1 Tax=Lachancea nothofagi CBS 11611 TaxID=1266666 RepID=A0A1G4KBV7_9SACH|nr:LANO_0F13586g1_1 [Lachancea nothofagi CBS 11611]